LRMNSFGRIFRVNTFGESHGLAVGCVVDGCPAGLKVSEQDIQGELERRRPGQSELTTSRAELDRVRVLSGLYHGRTLGTPIALVVENEDRDSSKYREIGYKPRPGHADLTWKLKFGHVDPRGGGRASARETVGRVAAGAIAKKLLAKYKVCVVAYTKQVGKVESGETLDSSMKGVTDLIESNPVRALDVSAAKAMAEEVVKAKKAGDSVGGVIECVALNVPEGLGEPVFDKLTAELAKAVMSIPGTRGVEFGQGFESVSLLGSQSIDEYFYEAGKVSSKNNYAAGIQGGISNGMPIVLRVAFKPTASISKRQHTVDLNLKKNTYLQVGGRHDPCIVPRAVPVVEAMVNMVLADHMMISGKIPRRI